MQISRHLLVTCAVAACLTPTFVHAADNEVQIRARQALEEKMNQIGTQPPPVAAPTNPAPAVSKPKAPAPKPMAAKPAPPAMTITPNRATVENQPAPSAPPAVSMSSNGNATDQKLQEALHQKMQQTPAEPSAPVMATQKPARPANMPAQSSPMTTASKMSAPAPTPAPSANYAPLPMDNSAHPTLPTTPTPMPAPAMSQNQPTQPSTSLPALTGPASGLSSNKQQKLDDLLQQYRLDQITPQQYHEQRAKILSEP